MIEKRILRCNVQGLVLMNILTLVPAVVAVAFFPHWSVAGLFLVWLFALIFSMFHTFRVVLHDDFLVVQYPFTPWRARCIPKGAIQSVQLIAVMKRRHSSNDDPFDHRLTDQQWVAGARSRGDYRIDHKVEISLAGSAPLYLSNFEIGNEQACRTINQWRD